MYKNNDDPATLELNQRQTGFYFEEKSSERLGCPENNLCDLQANRNYSRPIGKQRPKTDANSMKNESRLEQESKRDSRLATEELSKIDRSSSAENESEKTKTVPKLFQRFLVESENENEKIWTIPELCQLFSVSSKTISRWRKNGLVACPCLQNGKKRVGFKTSALQCFALNNQRNLQLGTSKTITSEKERNFMLTEAQRLAQLGYKPTRINQELAKQTGRSPETIRKITKQLVTSTGENGELCSPRKPRIDDEQKATIYREYKDGATIDELAQKYERTSNTICRVVFKRKLDYILSLPLDFIASPEFEAISNPELEKQILRPLDRPGRSALDASLDELSNIPLLTPEDEIHLFRKYNYLKFKASVLRERIDPQRPKLGPLEEIERLYDEAVCIKKEIFLLNLRLVYSITLKYNAQERDLIEDLADNGNISLLKAVEKFDYTRGFKFSTYACRALFVNFKRNIPKEKLRRQRQKSEEILESIDDFRSCEGQQLRAQAAYTKDLERLEVALDDRERDIIRLRFGLGGPQIQKQTLRRIGREIGITKERVRQIEMQAMTKMENFANKHKIKPDLD